MAIIPFMPRELKVLHIGAPGGLARSQAECSADYSVSLIFSYPGKATTASCPRIPKSKAPFGLPMERQAHSRPAQLSGGEQQRVAVARALVLQPKILVMDEPLSSLDEDLRAELPSELPKWHREIGFTLLYVTHHRGEASTMGQRVLTMKNGAIR